MSSSSSTAFSDHREGKEPIEVSSGGDSFMESVVQAFKAIDADRISIRHPTHSDHREDDDSNDGDKDDDSGEGRPDWEHLA
ncbi:hypothetical protein ACS0TY_020719 [Phlomoides rotata]